MSDSERHERLIGELASELRPVRRLPRPWLRALQWLALVIAIGVGLSLLSDIDALCQRLASVPDVWLAVLGSSLAAPLAAIAAFQTSVPGRSPRWTWLPFPAMLLWIGASGLGCLRSWIVPGTHDASLTETRACLTFIVCLSVPFSLMLVLMLRRAFPLRPALTATLGGLASAAAAGTLLNLFHPYDAAATDLVVHAFAVAAVILGTRALGASALSDPDA